MEKELQSRQLEIEQLKQESHQSQHELHVRVEALQERETELAESLKHLEQERVDLESATRGELASSVAATKWMRAVWRSSAQKNGQMLYTTRRENTILEKEVKRVQLEQEERAAQLKATQATLRKHLDAVDRGKTERQELKRKQGDVGRQHVSEQHEEERQLWLKEIL